MPDPPGDQHEAGHAVPEAAGGEAAGPTILDAVEVGGTWTVLGDGRRRPEVQPRPRRRWSFRRGAAAAGAGAVLVAGMATGYWLLGPGSAEPSLETTDSTGRPAVVVTGPATIPTLPPTPRPAASPSGPASTASPETPSPPAVSPTPAPGGSAAPPSVPPTPSTTIQPTGSPSETPAG